MTKKITNFGTCRVFNAMHLMAKEKTITLNNGHFFNYTQAMPETLQQRRIMSREYTVPEHLEPYFFDKHLTPGPARKHPDLSETDLAVCEISTVKNFCYDGVYFQINHLIRHLIEPHGTLLKPWFDATNALDEGRRKQELEKVLAGDHQLSELEVDILKSLKVAMQSTEELHRDIIAFRESFNAPILLVTHCDVIGDQGVRIETRVALIEAIAAIAKQEGIEVFQPSELIEKYGQETVMDKAGKDSNHYHADFYPILAKHLFTRWMA